MFVWENTLALIWLENITSVLLSYRMLVYIIIMVVVAASFSLVRSSDVCQESTHASAHVINASPTKTAHLKPRVL